MDHEDVHEQHELAAVEPGGLERLMAGDTLTAAAAAGHLAGCEACTGELQRLGRATPLLRDVIRTTPPPELRERTLQFVRAHGEPRGTTLPGQRPASPAAPSPPIAARSWPRLLPWVATIAAAVILSVAATSLLVGRQVEDQLAAQTRAIEALQAVTAGTVAIAAGPDARHVALASTANASTNGTLLFSPTTTELVVVAYDLDRPPAGQEYRCWVELDGRRENVGRMFFAGELAFWVGDTPAISDVPPGTTFGVSLTEVGGSSLEADPVIVGQL
jgi:hypothetical protein